MITPEEQVLLEGCRRGDEAAWLALYRAYAADVGSFLNGMLRKGADTDDLVQKVFLEFLSSLPRFRGESSLRTWLLRIARHVALRELRTRGRRENHVRAYAQTVRGDSVSPEDQILARQQLALIGKLLDTLDERYREAWTLRELAGCSTAEAAAILEIPEATVRSRHHRARRKLFDALAALEQADERALTSGPLRVIDGGSA